MSEKPNFLEDIQGKKPESYGEESFVSRRRNFTPLYAILAVIIIVTLVVVFFINRGVEVPDMTGWSESEVYNWGQTNDIAIVKELDYSIEIDTGNLISQKIEAGQVIKKSTPFNIVVSKGSNPNESIKLINMKETTLSDLEKWIEENLLTGITIKKENSDVIEKDHVIEYNIVDGTEENFVRKNRITVLISSGPEEVSNTVSVPDFYKKSEKEVMIWANANGISVSFEEIFDEYSDYGQIISQSIKKETKITREDVIAFEISLGQAIVVPDFNGLTKTEAETLATRQGIPVYFEYVESTRDPNLVLSQDLMPGQEIHKEQEVVIEISKESDYIVVPNFVGLKSDEASTLAGLHNVRLFFITIDSTEDTNVVLQQDISSGGLVNRDSYVTLEVSSGDLIVPDFIGLTKENCQTMAELNSLSLVFNEVDTVEEDNNVVLAQNIEAGTIIDKGKQIKIDIARNSGIIAVDMSSMTREEASRWASRNSVSLVFVEEYSDKYTSGKLYNQSLKNEIIPTNEDILIYCSLGQIGLTDFSGSTKLVMTDWMTDVNSKGGNVSLNFIPVDNSTKEKGTIINHNYKSDYIALDTVIDVWISMSTITLDIPDMTGVEEQTFIDWCTENHVSYEIAERYSDDYMEGALFGQEYKNEPLPEGEALKVYRSIGKLHIDNCQNQPVEVFMGFINGANLKGADIEVIYADKTSNNIPKGYVLEQSVTIGYLSCGSTMTVTISAGKYVTMPQFEGRMIDNAVNTMEAWNLEYEITYEYSSEEKDGVFYPKNQVISQSEQSGSEIPQNRIIRLVVSLGEE